MKILSTKSKFFWPGLAVAILLVWNVFALLVWGRVFHALTAFFLGVFVLILLAGAVRLCLGASQQGLRWLLSGASLRISAWTLAFAVSTVILLYQVELWRGRMAWAGVVEEAKAQGESLVFKSGIQQPVSDEQNFAKLPLFAPLISAQPLAPDWNPRIDKDLVFTEQHAPPYQNWYAKELPWTDHEKISLRAYAEYYEQKSLRGIDDKEAAKLLLNAFKQYDVILGQVREYSTRPFCQFPMSFNHTEFAQPLHLAAFHDLEKLLGQRASAELVLNQSQAAFEDTQLAFHLVNYYRQQAPAISERRNLVLTALQPLWEGLASRSWDAQQLSALQRQLEQWNLLRDYQDKVRADALYLASFVESVIPTSRSPNAVRFKMPDSDELSIHLARIFYPTGWSLQDQAAIHRYHLGYTRTVGSGEPPSLRSQARKLIFASDDPFFPVFVVPKVVELAHQAALSYMVSQTMVNEAMLACALERYRLAHGAYPESLRELVPDFMSKIPVDLVNGEPLRFHRSAEGRFVLYSIGYDNVDEGGKPSPRYANGRGIPNAHPDWRQGDWVWKYSVRDR